MNLHLVILLGTLLLNGVISWLNAVGAGRAWAESRAVGGFPRLLVWCAAIQSAVGFSSILLFALLGVAHVFHVLPPAALGKATSLWYVLIIVPALGSGLIIMVQSWQVAFRDRSLANMGVAAYNTAAMAHNVYSTVQSIGGALSDVGSLFSDLKSDDDAASGIALVVITLVLLALSGGILLTQAIIKRYAGTVPLPARVAAEGSAP